ncbi:hypothetical protein LTR28_005279 [Elasticomyces elasticus]|nr:hypothetical protein LTR28_005279 [Elasticomyces elasticus]
MDVVSSGHVRKATSKPFPFFQLPRELRDHVYESLVANDSHGCVRRVSSPHPVDFGLRGAITLAQLLTNHQFHEELEHTFVRCALLYFNDMLPDMYPGTDNPIYMDHGILLPGVLSNIQNVKVILCGATYRQPPIGAPNMARLEEDIPIIEGRLVSKVPGMRKLELELRNQQRLDVTQSWTEVKEERKTMRARWVRCLSQMDETWKSTTFLKRLDFYEQSDFGPSWLSNDYWRSRKLLVWRYTRDGAIETFEQVCLTMISFGS